MRRLALQLGRALGLPRHVASTSEQAGKSRKTRAWTRSHATL